MRRATVVTTIDIGLQSLHSLRKSICNRLQVIL
jgi:hypothetical protein